MNFGLFLDRIRILFGFIDNPGSGIVRSLLFHLLLPFPNPCHH
jgi:hypothetical protein